ncbi:MAG: D-alanyl-D-alanine carboxypeptidase family protein, partial [Lachnospiraceae bacterium]|nr:D-alanyl-D-alanine carboxypeptidase family protein [Lachnospiraceae bacterium]
MKTVLLKYEDIHKGYLILVNKEYRYYEQRQNLSYAGVWNGEEILYGSMPSGSMLLESRANHELNKLMEEIGGWKYIVPVSAWRSLSEQQEIWDQSLQESGQEFTEQYVAIPGHSEHQTGLAIDLAWKQEEIDFIRPYFPYEGICQTFRQKAVKYGLIQRYQEEKQSVTQIGHEPWHFRYVGTPHAEIMAQKGFALEEYIAFLKDFRYGKNPFIYQKYKISFVKAAGDVTEIAIDDAHPYR